MLGAAEGFLAVGAVMAVGFFLGRSPTVRTHGAEVLARITFNAATPALFFVLVSGADATVVLSPVGVATLAYVLVGGAGFMLAHRLLVRRRRRDELPLLTQGAVFANAGNIGIPLSLATVGDLTYVTVLILVQVFVLTPLGIIVLDLAAGGARPAMRDLLRLAVNPVLLAAGAGLVVLLAGLRPPEALLGPVDLLAATSVPLTLLLFGMSFRERVNDPPADGRAGALVVTWKTVIMPMIAAGVGLWLGLRGTELFGVVLLATLPSAQNLFVLALRYRTAVATTHSFIVVSTVVSVPVVLLLAATVPY